MDKLKRKLKNHLNIWLFISLVLTIMVPFTGIYVHKLAATLFLILTIMHIYLNRKKLKAQKYLLLATLFISYISGIFVMIFDEYTFILTIHKVFTILLVIAVAVHILMFIKNKGQIKMNKREREKETVSLMIQIYCKKKHGGETLCPECAALDAYARSRSDKCPFMETKTFCSSCKVHCYKPDMREKIKEVMRFSGPRMIFYHPIMAIRHLIDSKKEAK